MDVTNCLTIRMLTETFDSGDLHWLKKETDRYIRLHFEELRKINSGNCCNPVLFYKRFYFIINVFIEYSFYRINVLFAHFQYATGKYILPYNTHSNL